MVFWSNLKLKLKNVFTRSDFEREAVKLTGNQTIRGNKTFENDVSINSTLSMNDNPIRAVKYPEREGEAANKKYVDDAISNIPSVDLSNYYTKTESNNLLNSKANITDLDRYIKIDNTDSTNIKITSPGEAYFEFEKIQPREGYRNWAGIKYIIKNGESAAPAEIFKIFSKDTNTGVFMSCESNKFSFTNPTTVNNVANPVNPTDAVNKSYVDNGYYRKGNIPTPTGANDAVNKSYVDNKPGLGIRTTTKSVSSFRVVNLSSNQYLITFTVDTRGINQILGIIFNTVTNLNFVPIKYFINTSNGTCVVLTERNYFDLQTPTSVTIKYL